MGEPDAKAANGVPSCYVAFTSTAGGVPPLASTMDVIMDFMVSTGTLKPADRPMASDLLDGSILDFIANDPGLATTASGDQ